jgi:hypothetical protein
MNWFTRISNDIGHLPQCMEHYEAELLQARQEVKINGNIEKQLAQMPGITERRMADLQTIESILEHLNIQLRKTRSQQFRKFLEGYNRALTSRDAEKYVDGTDDVIDMEVLINNVAYLRNQYLGIIKSLESKQWMLGHVVKVRCAGMSDLEISDR